MDELLAHIGKVRVPSETQAIYRDECVYSFDNPESPTGLYVNLYSFLGFGENYAKRYAHKTGNVVFLHIQRKKTLKDGGGGAQAEDEGKKDAGAAAAADAGEEVGEKLNIAAGDDGAGPNCKITRLAIGLEGGYKDADKYEYKDTHSIVVFGKNELRFPYPDDELPFLVTSAVATILASESAIDKLKKQAVTGTWDGEVRQISKYAQDLKQLDNGKKIPPTGWKCEKCDLTNNLWLNLTDGSILCGRRFFDGSGGNDHAVEHYKACGYPLAVKLGTITADGKSDVFSYPEDDMVIDAKLEEHLAHFGINMAAMKKSEKSMVELELEINQRVGEWSLLTESDSELQPLTGPGLTGMRNLGNSCYINSVMQVLFTVPDFIERYVGDGAEKYFSAFPPDPANDFDIQMAKLGNGLWSGKYSGGGADDEPQGIAPNMFKGVVGKNHPDFSTKQQQDAFDFYLHMINMLERNSRNQKNPSDAFSFRIEERVECMSSKKVKYNYREEYCLPIIIPIESAINKEEVDAAAADAAAKSGQDAVRYLIPFDACVKRLLAPETIEQFYSSAIKGNTTAKKTTRLSSMPDYLMMHLRKFTLGDDWVPKKLNVSIDMPDELDTHEWRATGLQSHEELLPEETNKTDSSTSPQPPSATTTPAFVFDETVMSELQFMGFPQEACKRAIYYTKNLGLESASQWLMAHIADPDILEPFVVPSTTTTGGMGDTTSAATGGGGGYKPDMVSVAKLMSMGFDERQATNALKATDGNVERATDWIFSHMDDMDADTAAAAADEQLSTNQGAVSSSATKTYRDGVGKYKLLAFISHMGTKAQVGHYVCHIRKDGQWVIFNDEKVALSQKPPKDLGYLYIYKREE